MTRNFLHTCLFLLFLQGSLNAQQNDLPSSVYAYQMMPSESTDSGEMKSYVDWKTKFFRSFQMYLKAVNPGMKTVDPDISADAEKLIIVKEGTLGIEGADFEGVFEERSVVLVPPGKELKFFAADGLKASYFMIQWAPETGTPSKNSAEQDLPIEPFAYSDMHYNATAKGGRRSIRQTPSTTLKELEMHITTLKEGEKSHDPHTHIDEEIIFVLQGEVEEMINGTPYRLGPGSVIFLASMDPHGIRNAGRGTCEYYAIRFTPFE